MGALFSRRKVWDDFETLFNEDLNAEFNEIYNNLSAFKISGASENVTQFLTTLDPGDVGSENLPESIAEELQTLRFQIEAIIGGSAWIDDPPTSLTDVGVALDGSGLLKDNRIVSGLLDGNSQPAWLMADGAAAEVNLLTSVPLSTFINGSQSSFDSDLNFSGLSLAPGANNTALVNGGAILGGEETKLLGERSTNIPIDTVGSEITSIDGELAAFKINNGVDDEYFIAEFDATSSVLRNAYRGYFFDSVGLSVPRITINNNDTITLMRLTWVFARNVSGVKSIDVTLNQPFVQADQPASPASGDYWFDLNTSKWKKFSGSAFEVADAIFVGSCIQDSSVCIAARSADLTKPYSDVNTMTILTVSANEVRSEFQSTNLNAYGNNIFYEQDYISWNMPGDLDSGESESINTTYYLYLTQNGDPRLSTMSPHDRCSDLFGEYHPSKPYRAVGAVLNDGASDFAAAQSYKETRRESSSVVVLNSSLRLGVGGPLLEDGSGDLVLPIAGLILSAGNLTLTAGNLVINDLTLARESAGVLGLQGITDIRLNSNARLRDAGNESIALASDGGTTRGSLALAPAGSRKLVDSGSVSVAGGTMAAIPFNVTFLNPPEVVITIDNVGVVIAGSVNSITTTQFDIIKNNAGTHTVRWVAVGDYI